MGKADKKAKTDAQPVTGENIEETVAALPEDDLKVRLQWTVENEPDLATAIQNDPSLSAEQIDEKLTENGVPSADEIRIDSEGKDDPAVDGQDEGSDDDGASAPTADHGESAVAQDEAGSRVIGSEPENVGEDTTSHPQGADTDAGEEVSEEPHNVNEDSTNETADSDVNGERGRDHDTGGVVTGEPIDDKPLLAKSHDYSNEGHDIQVKDGEAVTGTAPDSDDVHHDEHVQNDKILQARESGDDPMLREGGHLTERGTGPQVSDDQIGKATLQNSHPDLPITGRAPDPDEQQERLAKERNSTVPTPSEVVGFESHKATDAIDAQADKPKRSIILVRLEETLDRYVKTMAGNVAHDPREGADIQRQFYRNAIEGVVYAQNSEDFIAGMNLLLDTIEENIDGVFNDRYAFRYWDQLTLPRKQALEFEHLLRLFTHIAPKGDRKDQLTKNNLDFTLSHVQNEEYRERLAEYLRRMAA